MKTSRISFAITPENKKRVKEFARGFGLTMSAYCRSLALGIRSVNYGRVERVEFKVLKPPKTPENVKTQVYKEVLKELNQVLEKRRQDIEKE